MNRSSLDYTIGTAHAWRGHISYVSLSPFILDELCAASLPISVIAIALKFYSTAFEDKNTADTTAPDSRYLTVNRFSDVAPKVNSLNLLHSLKRRRFAAA